MAFIHLTQKEFNVGYMVAHGKTIRQSSAINKISFHTASTYMRRIYKKFGVHDQANFARVWAEHEHTFGRVFYKARKPETESPNEVVLFTCLETQCKQIMTSTALFSHARTVHLEPEIHIDWSLAE